MSPLEQSQREAVVAEALTWLGTKFHHCADVKGAGVDCAMLLYRSFVDTGVITDKPDPRPYSTQWFLHKKDRDDFVNMVRFLGGHEVEKPKRGDICVWKVGHAYAHGGIMMNENEFVHAWAGDGMVTTTLMEHAPHKLVRYFTFWPEV